jgi:hypothetical protein
MPGKWRPIVMLQQQSTLPPPSVDKNILSSLIKKLNDIIRSYIIELLISVTFITAN